MLGKTFPIQVDSFHLTSSFISLMISFLRCLYLDPHQIQRKVLWENKGHRAAQICLSGYVKFANRDKKSLNCNLWFVWKVDCRCISRMTIWSHQVVLPLLVSYMGSCSTCVQQSFSPTCDNCRSLWALALLSIHVIVIHNERNTLKASCFPAAALQPATSQLVKRNHIPPVLASLFWTSTFWEVFPLL